MRFFKFISEIFDVSVRARAIRADEEKRKKSVRFAITSIIYSIFAVAFACVGGFLISLESAIVILTLVFGIGLLAVAAVSVVASVVRVIVQFTINRSVMSWVALAILILSVAAAVSGAVVLAT